MYVTPSNATAMKLFEISTLKTENSEIRISEFAEAFAL